MKRIELLFLFVINGIGFYGQSNWILETDKDSIRLYTKMDANGLRMFKVEFTIRSDIKTVTEAFNDPYNIKRWGKDISEFDIFEKKNGVHYYRSVFDSPWPSTDRESIMGIEIEQTDTLSEVHVKSRPEYEYPKSDDYVRIENAYFHWIFKKTSENSCFVKYIGKVDPAGMVPTWLANQMITQGPIDHIYRFKKFFEEPARQ